MNKSLLIFRTVKGYVNEAINTLLNSKEKFETFQSFYDDVLINLKEDHSSQIHINDTQISDYGIIYFFGPSKNPELTLVIASYLKTNKIRFIDTSASIGLRGGKLLQMLLCNSSSIPIPQTIFCAKEIIEKHFDKIKAELGFPFIMKSTSGGLGEEVFLIDSLSKVLEVYANFPDLLFIFQRFVPNSFDYRIMVFGGIPKVVVKRTRSSKSEFRNNVAQGATKEIVDIKSINPELLEIASQCSKVLERNIAGVDIVLEEGTNKPYVLEVNPAPGFNSEIQLAEFRNYISLLLNE